MSYQYRYPFYDAEEETKRAVWDKGRIIVQNGTEYDPEIWRWDICGHVMKYSEHGNTDSNTAGKLITLYLQPKVAQMSLIIFNLFNGKTIAERVIPILGHVEEFPAYLNLEQPVVFNQSRRI